MSSGQDHRQNAHEVRRFEPESFGLDLLDHLKKLSGGFNGIFVVCCILLTWVTFLLIGFGAVILILILILNATGNADKSRIVRSLFRAVYWISMGSMWYISIAPMLFPFEGARLRPRSYNPSSRRALLYLFMGILPTLGCAIVQIVIDKASDQTSYAPLWYEPGCFEVCTSRVDPQQGPLFTSQIYISQFDEVWGRGSRFNASNFAAVHDNHTLCSNGFQGNSDIYGIGVRVGIYTQWFASLCANQLQPEHAKELQKVYLIFSTVLCVVTLTLTLQTTCVFAIEIEILHWLFWGGSFTVFLFAPDSAKLKSGKEWVKLTSSTAIQFCSRSIMMYHGAWFVWFAYDHVFTKMPCGTYQFLMWKLIDPSTAFWVVRYVLVALFYSLVGPLLLACPLVIIVFASETSHSIRHSTLFQIFFNKEDGLHGPEIRSANSAHIPQSPHPVGLYQLLRIIYGRMRQKFGLPAHSQAGIRLITPVDLKDRKNYRIRCALLSSVSFITSITAIELTLKWNRVTGINSLNSVGQYMPLTIGIASLISLLWRLMVQEAERRRKLKSHQRIDAESEELQLLSYSMADALAHAFQQADTEYLTNGGIRPPTSWADEDEERSSISSSVRPSMESLHSANEFGVSNNLLSALHSDPGPY